jgi:hypothetical protein
MPTLYSLNKTDSVSSSGKIVHKRKDLDASSIFIELGELSSMSKYGNQIFPSQRVDWTIDKGAARDLNKSDGMLLREGHVGVLYSCFTCRAQ